MADLNRSVAGGRAIYPLRGQWVMLSTDLAVLFEVEPRALVQAVKRNSNRFPTDFMFQLQEDEWTALKSQSVISKGGPGGIRRARPYAFTEHGCLMLANVLRSERAIAVSIEVVRSFMRLRDVLATNVELSGRLNELEKKYDNQFRVVFEAIRQLMSQPPPTAKSIGFRP